MNVNSLISRHGQACKINNAHSVLFIDEQRLSYYKKGSDNFTGINLCSALVGSSVSDTDIVTTNNIEYRVFECKQIIRKGSVIYSDVLLFEDDFTNEIEIVKQSLATKGSNLPSVIDSEKIILKARVNTVKNNEYLQYSMHSNKPPTHKITIIFDGSDIQITDLIKWGDRRFEILSYENVDEKNRIIIIDVIEVLSG